MTDFPAAELWTMPGIEVGFYGKLPSHGDFLRRRVSDAFVAVWDGWLQECTAASRAILGDRWLDVYLTSPAWRFACAPGTCGESPVVGIMVPSVDRVGRYFHLTFATELPPGASVVAAASALAPFFDAAEQLAVETLAADHVDFEHFDDAVAGLRQHLAGLEARGAMMADPSAAALLDAAGPWHMPLATPPRLAPLFEALLAQRLAALYDPLVLWWTEGSENVEPSLLFSKGLPRPESFAALLDGAWTAHQWQSVPGPLAAVSAPGALFADDPTPPKFRSSASTDVGKVRAINQDSFLERPEVGLWVVADGMGGHSDGEVASRMVCDALADFIPDASFEQMIAGAGARVQEVNDHLVRMAERSQQAVHSGSTVVALLLRATRCAVLWAGDSRAYRLRDGRLEQLTRDHSLAEAGALEPGVSSSAITRAVGGEPSLELEAVRDRVRAGDRFLLCSDGLTRTLPDDRIGTLLGQQDIRAAAADLVQATLAAGAPDNVTVVVVEAY